MKKILITILAVAAALPTMAAGVTLPAIKTDNDTYVTQASPDKSYGKSTELITCRAPGNNADVYVKFTFKGITVPGTKVLSAKLRLYALTTSDATLYFHSVPNNWGEPGMDWNKSLTLNISREPIARVTGTTKGQWVEVELSDYIKNNHQWNVVVRCSSPSDVLFASREYADDKAPELVITLDRPQEVIIAAEDNVMPSKPVAVLPPKPVPPFPIAPRAEPPLRGLYYNYTDQTRDGGVEFTDHDLLDGAWFAFSWKNVEPERGKVSQKYLQYMKEQMDRWINASARAGHPGRKAIVRVPMQGLVTQDTPPWIYRQNGGPVERVAAAIAQDNRPVAAYYAPVTWYGKEANADYLVEVEVMVRGLAAKFDNDPNVAAVQVCLGHLGHTTVSMNKEFAPKFLAKGWNPEAWLDFSERVMDIYLKYFKNKQLIVVGEDGILREATPPPGSEENYRELRDKIVGAARQRGIGVLLSTLIPDTEEYIRGGFPALLESYRDLSQRGICSVGVFDDWPIYDPYRLTAIPIDADYFIRSMRNGIGPVEGKYPRTSATFMVTFSKEIWGSYQGRTKNLDYYRDDVREAVKRERNILLGFPPDAPPAPVPVNNSKTK